MRILVMDDAARLKVKTVLDHALVFEHWYRPHKDAQIAGNDPRFVAHLDDGFRCVFTITVDLKGDPWRRLSISVPGEKYPSPTAVCAIAAMFGFTGWDGYSVVPPRCWALYVDKDDHCIAIGQEYKP